MLCKASYLGLMWLLIAVQAQVDSTHSQNLTLRLFETNQEGRCSYENSTDAPTFTTSSIPPVGHCFTFSDLFEGNSTQGYVNQSQWITDGASEGISWQIRNTDTYDPRANYSSILYHRHSQNPDNEATAISVNIYAGQGCIDAEVLESKVRPWYGFSCWTDAQGTCGQVGYPILSFRLSPESESEGSCMRFAEGGGAMGGFGFRQPAMSTVAALMAAAWLMI